MGCMFSIDYTRIIRFFLHISIIKEARLPHVKWELARDEHRQLSARYLRVIDAKKLCMHTLSTITINDYDSNLTANQITDVAITCF